MNLTPKQLKILTRIRDIRLTQGYSPTMQELADELGISKVTVFEHVQELIKKGALEREPTKARSLRVNPNFQLPDAQRGSKLPLVGTIAAGSPIEAVEQREHLDLEELFAPPGAAGNTFVLKVKGDSMIEEHICEGDFVICERRQSARNGEMVVALVEGEDATLKRFYKENGRIRLQPANQAYEPIWVDDCQVQGIVVGLIRTNMV